MGALDIGLGIAATGVNALTQKARERRTMGNQKKLMDLQMSNQMKLNTQGHNLQMQMWKDTNYPAQMEQMKLAGLNPALMYGMSGGGGTTTGSQGGGSASGGNAPAPQQMDISQIMQTAMIQAQIELAEAQAEKARAEATYTSGSLTTSTETGILKVKAEIKNLETQNQIQELDKTLKAIEAGLKQEEIESNITKIKEETNRIIQDRELTLDQYSTIIAETKARTVLGMIQAEATKKGIELTEQQITESKQKLINETKRIEQSEKGITQRDTEIEIKAYEATLKEKFPAIWDTVGGQLQGLLRQLETIGRKAGFNAPHDAAKPEVNKFNKK